MARRYDDRTLKILFAQAAGRCAFPGCSNPLIASRTPADEPAVLGQIAHIVASSDNGPRGDASFPRAARDKEPNLVLLCRHHHALVDAQDATYTIEDLRRWKKDLVGDPPDAASLVQEATAKLHEYHREDAVDLLERALACAQDDDLDVRRRAHLGAATCLIAAMGSGTQAPDAEAIGRVERHLRGASEAGAGDAQLLVARAWLAGLQQDADSMLTIAERAILADDASAADRADGLNAQLSALRALRRDDEALAVCAGPAKDALIAAAAGYDESHFQLAVTRLITLADNTADLTEDVDQLTTALRPSLVDSGTGTVLSPAGTAHGLDELASVLASRGHLREALDAAGVAHEYAERQPEVGLTLSIALRGAELAAYFEEEVVRRFLQSANRSAALAATDDSGSAVVNTVLVMFTSGRCLSILADRSDDPTATDAFLSEALDGLQRAIEIAESNRRALSSRGDVDLLLADVSYWAGHAAAGLGQHQTAATHFRAVHCDAAKASPSFWTRRALPAWLDEAKALRLTGQLGDAHRTLRAVLAAITAVREQTRDDDQLAALDRRTRAMLDHMENYQLPVLNWMDSEPAQGIGRATREATLPDNVAVQLAPLVSWWKWWTRVERGGGPLAELFDFWGRGGLCRVAAAVRGSPHRSVAVDARSVADIRRWARMLCPLFDTVIVKWKAPLGDGVVTCPLQVDYAGPGGHGYDITNEVIVSSDDPQSLDQGTPEWAITVSSAALVGRDLASFLATEASALVEAGRLVVVPAALVGCTQSATGWTDSLFVDGLLGGAVSVIDMPSTRRAPESQRVLDLTSTAVPYIDNVSMADLARILQEADDWLGPLRAVMLNAIGSRDVSHERWERITILEDEINDACRELEARYDRVVAAEPQREWRVHQVDAVTAAVERPQDLHEPLSVIDPITETLSMLAAPVVRDPAPWIPFWRLRGVGGHLRWSCPLDNRVRAADARQAQPQLAISSWLHPGTPGFGVRPAIMI